MVIKVESPYNMLPGHPTLNALRAVFSAYHLSFKFLTPTGITQVTSDVKDTQECYLTSMTAASSTGFFFAPKLDNSPVKQTAWGESSVLAIDTLVMDTERPKLETGDQVEEVMLCLDQHTRVIQIGWDLIPKIQDALVSVLQEYRGIFTWTTEDVLRIPAKVMIHNWT